MNQVEKPLCPRTSPYAVPVEAGKKYFWCACGRSKNQPFCDGSHATTVFRPVQFVAEKSEVIYFCGCKQTGTKPLCDGTHEDL
jgi:CDGSH-type Zn-finger protein